MPICYNNQGVPYVAAQCPGSPAAPGPGSGTTAPIAGGGTTPISVQVLPQSAINALDQAGSFFQGLQNPTTWKRFGLVTAGVLAVVLGVVLLAAKPAEKISSTTGQVVKA